MDKRDDLRNVRPIERRADRVQQPRRITAHDLLRNPELRDDYGDYRERRDDRDRRRIARRYDDRDRRFVYRDDYRQRDRDRYIYVDDRDRYYVDYGRDRHYDYGRDDYLNNRGPAFCRSGAGHPVFGRRWCEDRGYSHGRRDTRYVYIDDRDRYYIDYGRDRYDYVRPRHQRPRRIVHYVVLDDRDQYYGRPYDPYYNDPYYSGGHYGSYDPYHNAGYYDAGYYDPYYGDDRYDDYRYDDDDYYAGYDPYGYDRYDPYYRQQNGSLLESILQAIFFPESYYVEQPTRYVYSPRYYVAPTGYHSPSTYAFNASPGSPTAFNAYPSSYHPPTYSLASVSMNFSL